jgi:hypothetical protein
LGNEIPILGIARTSYVTQALRGAGASFGIVTSFTVITHPIPTTITHYSFQLTIGSPADPETPAKLAALYTKWQGFVSSPVVLADRYFNSTVIIMNWALLIQGTRFGTKEELEASEVMVLVNKHFGNVDLKSRELDWAASGVAWMTDVVYTITGGVVSSWLNFACSMYLLYCGWLRYFVASSDVHQEPLRQAGQVTYTESNHILV